MKLFTEQEIREAIAQGYDWCHNKYMPSDNMIELFIRELPVVELPTDEEIEKEAFKELSLESTNMQMFARLYMIHGAKWMRDKIKGGKQC